MPAMGFLEIAATQAKAYRDRVLADPHIDTVVVVPTVMGPSGYRVPCGTVHFPRCHADQFESGRLTITAMDNGYVMRVYEPGEWAECAAYGPDGHLSYGWQGSY